MANSKHIRKRIKTVKSTQKITKAMKMVAAAKLRRAQHAVVAARPYADGLSLLLSDIASRDHEKGKTELSPLLLPREEIKKTALLVFTSDRGLCGAFNSSIIKEAIPFIVKERSEGREVEIFVYGRKGRDGLTARGYALAQVSTDLSKRSEAEWEEDLANLISRYQNGEIDRITLLYNRFISAINQIPTMKTLLPFELPSSAEQINETTLLNYEYEPSPAQVIDSLLKRALSATFRSSFLESTASELGARMSAMDSATTNASEMIRKLTLTYNRARQAAITLELMDIVNGAESIA